MAVILSTAGFWAPFTYKVPGDDLTYVEKQMRLRWKRLDRTERKALDLRLAARNDLMRVNFGVKSATESETAALREKAITEEQFLVEMLVDWDLKDARGHPVPFSPRELAETCELNDGIDVQMFNSYFTVLSDLANPKDLAKNSDAPSSTTS